MISAMAMESSAAIWSVRDGTRACGYVAIRGPNHREEGFGDIRLEGANSEPAQRSTMELIGRYAKPQRPREDLRYVQKRSRLLPYTRSGYLRKLKTSPRCGLIVDRSTHRLDVRWVLLFQPRAPRIIIRSDAALHITTEGGYGEWLMTLRSCSS